MVRVRVAEKRCQGHTMCNAIAPEVFQPREEDGHAVVVAPEVPSGSEKKVQRAIRACPEGAVILVDADDRSISNEFEKM